MLIRQRLGSIFPADAPIVTTMQQRYLMGGSDL
jgi:hypothetical protein